MTGAAYNLFDGEELLEGSIRSIRESVNFVCVVFQEMSNFGISRKSPLRPVLEDLMTRGWVDQIFEYDPASAKKGHGNEIAKRQIGLDLCRNAGCNYFISMDCDEYYKPAEFAKAKSIIIEDGYDSSACMMQTYYKDPRYRLDPPETYYVPFLYRIDERRLEMGLRWPVVADPTRKMPPKNIMAFTRNVIEMHHFSMLRKDIRAKLWNSSANVNFKNRIEEIAQHYEMWSPGTQAMMPGKERRMYDTVQVENYFNINI